MRLPLSLETISLKLFNIIHETGETELLNVDNHLEVWEQMQEDFFDLSCSEYEKKAIKEILSYKTKHRILSTGIPLLRFKKEDSVIETLNELGFFIDENNYMESLETLEKELVHIGVHIASLEKKIPKKELESKNKIRIDDILSSLSLYHKIDFNYNEITVSKFLALKKGTEEEIKNQKNVRRKNNDS